MTCMDRNEINTPIYEKFILKKIRIIRTNNMLEIELVYLYSTLKFNAINAFTTYTKFKS